MTTADGVNPAGIDRREYQRLVWDRLGAILDRLDYLEALMTTTRDEFDAGLAELGTAIFENADAVAALADRIDGLSANDVTDADLEQLQVLAAAARGATDRVQTLAVESPAVPTEGGTGGAGGGTEPTPEPTPEPAPGEGEAPA